MRVAHYLSEYPASTQTFVLPLLSHARAFEPEVWTLRRGGGGEEAGPAGEGSPPVLEIGGPGRTGVWGDRILARLAGFELREELSVSRQLRRSPPGIGLLHAHFGPQGFAAARPCARVGVPFLTSFYGYDLGLAREPAWQRRYRVLWRKCGAFLVEGPVMGAHLAALGAPRGRIRIQRLPVPVDTLPFSPRSWEGVGPLRLLQVARFVEKKGIDLSIRAVGELTDRGEEVELTLVGDGPLFGDLTRLAGALGVGDRVHFLGPLSHRETRELLLRSHGLVQPSRTAGDGDTEGGAPFVLLEAQATGMCVVASRHADIPNVVAGEAWFGFEEDDLGGLVEALLAFRACNGEWAGRGRAARGFVERHHRAGELVQGLEVLYGALLEGREPLPGEGP